MQFTDTPEELAEWIMVLRSVRGRTDAELKAMMDSARVNPRNAEVMFLSFFPFFLLVT